MAGHSKWNNIKNRKGKEDAKRAKVFTKLGRSIIVAAREGGPDPDYNPALKAAIDKAKAENMPNDNIDRAIKKATGDGSSDNYEEVRYEGYGPGGVAVLVDCLTDNRNRTAADVRHAFDKYGGNLGQDGCVSFMFDRKGLIAIERENVKDEDELTMLALDLGADDFVGSEDGVEIITAPDVFNAAKEGLEEAGYTLAMAEITFLPQNESTLANEEHIKQMNAMIDVLEDHDDVQEVYHNWDMEGGE
ncbi:MAG: YebC/PmpR family DNA-binding transcriptional regulator [Tissierellia bacterium]|nr:YebC/PmpR family DNA-binding transcriptional regulator [Tissierellia bacterium]